VFLNYIYHLLGNIIMSKVLFRSLSRQFISTKCITRSTGYYVVIPEVPDDTEETNAVLRTGSYPEFNNVHIQDCHRGLGKLLIEVETGVSRLEEKLLDNPERTFESVLLPLEGTFSNLHTASNLVKVKSYTQHDRLSSDTLSQLYLRIAKALVSKYENATIYRAVKELKSDEQHLTEYERRVVDKFLIEGRNYGTELTGKDVEKIAYMTQKLGQHCGIFHGKVVESMRRYKYMEYDPDKMQDFPEDVLYATSTDKDNIRSGPWAVQVGNIGYRYFMQYSTDRKARCSLWIGAQTLASPMQDTQLYTNENIQEITATRDGMAKLLGYESYPAMKVHDSMIGSVDNVQNMIATLSVKAKPAQEKELSDLREFASNNGASYKLEIWDVPFWARKQQSTFFERDPRSLISQYFPYDSVFSNVIKFAEELFSITFKKCDAETLHPDVSFYEVSDTQSGKLLGAFYVDPYVRPGKVHAHLMEGRKRSHHSDSVPYVSLLFNFEPPSSKCPSLLSLQDTRQLLKEFGSCMQQVLCEAPYYDISGVYDLEIDASDVISNFFENWIFEPTFLSRICSHWSTGEPIPPSVIQGIQQLGTHMTGHALCTQLYLADFDLTLHTDMKSGWGDVIRDLWPKYRHFHLDKKNYHPCSFTDIFVGRYGGAYYAHTWNQIVAADIYQAFQEVGPANTEEINKLGARFRETYLRHGNGIKSSELFRRFLGRDPSPYSLLYQLGLSQSKSPKKRKTE